MQGNGNGKTYILECGEILIVEPCFRCVRKGRRDQIHTKTKKVQISSPSARNSLFAVEHVITHLFSLFGGSFCLSVVCGTTLDVTSFDQSRGRCKKKSGAEPASDGMNPTLYSLHRTKQVVKSEW